MIGNFVWNAIKSSGRFNQLTIIAYAIVVKRNGKIYEHDPDHLGHIIHVEFLEINFSKFLGFNYGGSIHQINTNSDHFNALFGKYKVDENISESHI